MPVNYDVEYPRLVRRLQTARREIERLSAVVTRLQEELAHGKRANDAARKEIQRLTKGHSD